MMCEEVELSFDETQSREREANGQLPIGKITLAAGVLNPVGDAVDPQAGFNSNHQVVTMFKGRVNESRIFALELKKVTTEGWIHKELRLRSKGPDVDPTRLAAGESDDEDEDDEDGDEDTPEGSSYNIAVRRLRKQSEQYLMIVFQSSKIGSSHPFLLSLQPRVEEVRKTLILDLSASLRQAKSSNDRNAVLGFSQIFGILEAQNDALKVLKGG